ncbi:hypothetical protein A7982_13408 [Minicystis rosea]|nr:hypothetical protein A7982_13408 [Minicystis rosea]
MPPSPSASTTEQLVTWLETATVKRALVIEDGSTGSISPLARWLVQVRETGALDVIGASLGPTAGLVLERDIVVALYLELYPDDPETPGTFSLARLRDHVREGLRADASDRKRLVVLERVSWGEESFRRNLGDLLGSLSSEQQAVVTLRLEDGQELNISAWCKQLGWREEETLCLRLPALLDGDLTPRERAQQWINTCLAVGGTIPIIELLDVLAAARRPMRSEEVAAIVEVDPSAVHASLRHAPPGALVLDDAERYVFADPTVAHAWMELRPEASVRVRERLLALGEAALHGRAERVVPYVIEHYGALLAEHGGLSAQIPLVSEAWANAWSSLENPLGFEADVERVWAAGQRELLENASGPAASRLEPILTHYRCVQVSSAIMLQVRELGGTAGPRATALEALAQELDEPERTRVRERAVDALLAVDLKASDADILMRLAACVDGQRRSDIATRVLETYRTDVANGGNSIWLLRVAPLLSTAERSALVDEALAGLRDLPEHDAWALRDAVRAAPELALQLARSNPDLPRRDRFRFDCALAPYLRGDARQRIVEAVLETVEAGPFPLDTEDLRAVAPALDTKQIVRLFGILCAAGYDADFQGICIRALCASGCANEAEALAGPDPASMPFDWVLALASSSPDERPALREELERQLSAMDETRLGWTIERDAAELVGVLGANILIRFVRTITSGEERIVARVALVPFAAEPEKRALVDEAVAAFRAPSGQEALHWRELLSCWEWMSTPDACHLLIHGSHDVDALWALKDFAPVLRHLAGAEAPVRVAEQIIEVARWMP